MEPADGFDICAWAGHFDPFMPELQDDPHPYVRRLREACPVVHSDARGGYWVVSRYDDVKDVLQRPDVFSSTVNTTPVSTQTALGPDIPTQTDPPDHVKYRAILNGALSPKVVDGMEASMRASAVRLLEPITAKRQCEFVSEFAVPFPTEIFCDLMGLPKAELKTFLAWKDAIFKAETPELRRKVAATIDVERTEYFSSLYDDRKARSDPGDDLLGRLTTARWGGERPLTRDEWVVMASFLWIAGLHTVTAQLSFAMDFLSTHPAHRDQLVREPSLCGAAVEELMRYDGIVNNTRIAVADTEVGGQPMKAGDVVLLLYGLAGRDPQQFPDPDTVDFSRYPNRHFGFGVGIHRCAGSHLARMELRVALEEVHRHLPTYIRHEGSPPVRRYGWVRDVESLHLIVQRPRST